VKILFVKIRRPALLYFRPAPTWTRIIRPTLPGEMAMSTENKVLSLVTKGGFCARETLKRRGFRQITFGDFIKGQPCRSWKGNVRHSQRQILRNINPSPGSSVRDHRRESSLSTQINQILRSHIVVAKRVKVIIGKAMQAPESLSLLALI
jgi:hypothetical protein